MSALRIFCSSCRSLRPPVTVIFTLQYFNPYHISWKRFSTSNPTTKEKKVSSIPILHKKIDKATNTVTYVFEDSPILPKNEEPQTTNDQNIQNTTSALTNYDPSIDTRFTIHDTRTKKESHKSLLSQMPKSLVIEYKKDILKQMQTKFRKQRKNELKNQEISSSLHSYFDTIPKLSKIKHKFTDHELSKIQSLDKTLNISKSELKLLLKRYPFILKYDIENVILPRIASFSDLFVFCKQDTMSMVIRHPQLLSQNVSFWLQKKAKINKILNIHRNILHTIINKQPGILCNSIIKTTAPKLRFLSEKVYHKSELETLLYTTPSLLKVGWNRLARIEFLRSNAIPYKWKQNVTEFPPIKNALGDVIYNEEYERIAEQKKEKDEQSKNIRSEIASETGFDWSETKSEPDYRSVGRDLDIGLKPWHLNRPCVSWSHYKMLHVFPNYRQFLEEFTLRCKRSQMWTKKNLVGMNTKEMENIIGYHLKWKYSRRKIKEINWQQKNVNRSKCRKRKKMKQNMTDEQLNNVDNS